MKNWEYYILGLISGLVISMIALWIIIEITL